MKAVPFFNVASAQVSAHAGSVIRLRGNFNGTTAQRWLFLFDNNGQPAPANNTTLASVPTLIAPIPLFQSAPFFVEFEVGSLEFSNGLYAAVSTAQQTFTLSADTMDIDVELNDPEEPAGTSFAGDTATGVDSLAVYASDANKNLYSIRAKNNGGATAYLQLFTASGPATGQVPHSQWAIPAGAVLALVFGKYGTHPVDGPVASETQGVYLYGSSTAGAFTATSANQWNILAEYK